MWVVLSLLSAFSLATTDALSKKSLERSPEWVVVWIRFLFALPYLAVVFLFIEVPALDKVFWFSILILLPLEMIAVVLYIKAINQSPLSLTIPFLSLTPVFIILTGFLFLGELPDLSGTLGVLMIALGAYSLQLHGMKEGLLVPFKAILQERGSMLMIGVAFIYSITSTLGKVAILHSSPLFFGVFYFGILALAFTPWALMRSRRPWRDVLSPERFPLFLLIGVFEAIMIFSHTLAIVMTQVTYMIAVKRTSLLFSVAYGYLLFREGRIRERLMGCLLMVIGAMLIVLF
jgi:drug/metabolite transporter (DMT)-like permease